MQLFRTQPRPIRRCRPWNLTKGTTWKLKTPNFDLFSPVCFWDRMEVAKSRENIAESCMDWVWSTDCVERWKEALGQSQRSRRGFLLWQAPWPRKSLALLQVLVSHLYSKELKQEHSNISTKAALTAKEGKNAEVWEHNVNWKLVFFLWKTRPILYSMI